MIDQELLDILCCPETRQPLKIADAGLVETLNARIAKGGVKDRSGKPVHEAIDGALLRQDGEWVYLVRSGIPVLLVDAALPIASA